MSSCCLCLCLSVCTASSTHPLFCFPSTGILIDKHSAWGSLLFAAKRAATTIQVVQDGNCTLLGGMSKEDAKEALRSGM